MALPAPAPDSTALITGASAGIGAEIARQLARRGWGVTLVARREQRLRELADELGAEHRVRAEAIAADLGAEAERDRLAAAVRERGLTVEILVNNAGFGDSATVHAAERERLVEMVRLNCEALLDLQARYTPGMVDRGRGAVLNVASTAAFQPLPETATYAATKAFVLSLTEAANAELRGSGVTMTALCPGPVKTEFAEAAGIGSAEGRLPGVFWTSVEQVARQAVEGMEGGKRVVVPGLLNRASALTGQHSPRMIMLPLAERVWRRGTH
jgi:short-subunit dehydrogenase